MLMMLSQCLGGLLTTSKLFAQRRALLELLFSPLADSHGRVGLYLARAIAAASLVQRFSEFFCGGNLSHLQCAADLIIKFVFGPGNIPGFVFERVFDTFVNIGLKQLPENILTFF